MSNKGKQVLASLCAAALVAVLMPAEAEAKNPKDHDCGKPGGKTLQGAIDALEPGETLVVRGTCDESVSIHAGMRDITIDGGGTASIDRIGNTTEPLVTVLGKGITIKGLRVAGGRQGIVFRYGGTGTVDTCNVSGANAYGIHINTNSWARVVDSTIEGNGNGIAVAEHASAEIGFRGDFAGQVSPNTIRNNYAVGITVVDSSFSEIQGNFIRSNGGEGIIVGDNSSARIGSQTGVAGTLQSGNTIEANGGNGITAVRSANARIVGNDIRGNSGDGVGVFRASQADIADNEINSNTANGIFVSQNSGVNLGRDSGTRSADQPNRGFGNSLAGVRCEVNSSMDGRVGNLTGNGGAINSASSCTNSLNP